MAKIFIITGGIASGKSFLLKFLSRRGYSTFSSDLIVKKLLKDEKFLLVKGLGGKISAERVIAEEGLLSQLEEAFYPKIAQERALWLEKEYYKDQILFIEIPLLFEKFSSQKVLHYPYEIISTIATLELQRKRALKRGIKPELLEFLLARQVSNSERLAKSNWIIYTSQSKRKVKKAIKQIIYVSTHRNSF